MSNGDRPKFYVPGDSAGGAFQMVCKKCGCRHFEVVNTYGWTPEGKARRRQCRNCGWILKTVERPIDET